jgi:hypothetical protein
MTTHVAVSERLCLQPLSVKEHLEGYHALNSDERVSRWSLVPFLPFVLSSNSLLNSCPFLFNLFIKEPRSHYSRHRPATKDLDDAEKLMLARLPSAENPFMENYAIVLKSVTEGMEKGERGGMIGVIGIPRLSHDGLAAEVGYAITPDFWGRGYASEALILFVKHYFNSESKSLIAVPISRLSVCLSVCLSFVIRHSFAVTAREELKIGVRS